MLLDSRVDHLVLFDQALAGKLFGLNAYGKMIPARTHEVIDAGTAARQVRLDQFLNGVQVHARRVAQARGRFGTFGAFGLFSTLATSGVAAASALPSCGRTQTLAAAKKGEAARSVVPGS